MEPNNHSLGDVVGGLLEAGHFPCERKIIWERPYLIIEESVYGECIQEALNILLDSLICPYTGEICVSCTNIGETPKE